VNPDRSIVKKFRTCCLTLFLVSDQRVTTGLSAWRLRSCNRAHGIYSEQVTATRQLAMYLSQRRNALDGNRFDRLSVLSRYHDTMMPAQHGHRPSELVVELYGATVARLERTCSTLAKRASDGFALRAGGRQAPGAVAGDREHGPIRVRPSCLRECARRHHGQEEGTAGNPGPDTSTPICGEAAEVAVWLCAAGTDNQVGKAVAVSVARQFDVRRGWRHSVLSPLSA
jgi:hypothetical protein